jgi:hypothetical protein
VLAEGVALDGVGIYFEAVVEGGVAEDGVVTAEGAFPGFVDVLVLVEGGVVAEEDEDVGVAAVGDGGRGFGAEGLLE